MKRYFFSILFLGLLFGCTTADLASVPDSTLAEARNLLNTGKASCILIREGKIASVRVGGGVSPLLEMYDREGKQMRGAAVADKVIGRAAASILIVAGVKYVHSEVMSEDAMEFLAKYKVRYACIRKVPRILNRKRDGLCPLEKSVQGYDDPEQALQALRKRVAELSAAAKKKR